jgi:hypothetical protein
MDNIPVIDNWACVYGNGDAFTPPELRDLMVEGCVNGHYKYPDGKIILTSCIRKVEKDIIFTQNSTYRLGEPRKDWLDWLKENGIEFDPENPIKIR